MSGGVGIVGLRLERLDLLDKGKERKIKMPKNIVVIVCLSIIVLLIGISICGIILDKTEGREKEQFFKVGDGSGNFKVLEVY